MESTTGCVAGGANVAVAKLAGRLLAGVGGGKLKELPAPDEPSADAWADPPWARPVVRSGEVSAGTFAVASLGLDGIAVPAVSRWAGCAAVAGGVSARRVTVPLIEKSRSWAGPIASLLVGGGGAMTGGEPVVAVSSCASAGAAIPIASATAAELKRNPTLILTRLSGWSRARFAPRLRRFAAHPPDIQAHAG
jgi:hypothetical protein